MKKVFKLILMITALLLIVTACTSTEAPGEKGEEIITAKEALKSLREDNVVLVDARTASLYKDGHIKDAANIARNDITTFGPFPNMLASAEKIEKVFGENGIANQSTVIVYDDNNNMDAARLWWTMKIYGHEKVRVVSGGLKAMLAAGAETTTIIPDVLAVEYRAETINEKMLVSREEVKSVLDNPEKDIVLLDVRTREEYTDGTIPGSVHLNYEYNNFDDGRYRPIRQIHTLYRDKDISPEKTVIMYCKTSIRAAQTYLALYNAGYRELKIYDGAWLEWSADSSLPVEMPDGSGIEASFQDAS